MIAVTGANGLLGNFIVKQLVAQNFPVRAIVRKGSIRDPFLASAAGVQWSEADVLDVPALTTAMEGVSTVIHTAAIVSFNPRKARKIFETNVQGTRNVVDICLGSGITKLVHISSVAALGRQKGGGVIAEESRWVESALNSDYAESKYLAELEVFRGMEEGLSVAMVNPSVILAPADWTKSSAKLFGYVWDEKKFYIDGSINYVDVRDVAEMVIRLVKGDFNGQKFIASAGSVSFRKFFDQIASRFQKRAPSICVRSPWMEILARAEEIRSFFTGSEPLVTRQSVRAAKEPFFYANEKAKSILGIKFHSEEETLNWCCSEYLRKINTNK